MSKHLQRDMQFLQREILALAAMVEEMIDRATLALRRRDIEMAGEVIATDPEIDQREVRVEEECLKMLALHQPAARDLRRIATVMKVNNDLERIADLAVNIAERATCLAGYRDFPIPDRLDSMVNVASEMVRSSMNAFVNYDAVLARSICLLDDHVDRHNKAIIQELLSEMQERPQTIEPALHFFSASRHVERIADHATNIAEDVIYLVEGEIARHNPELVLPHA